MPAPDVASSADFFIDMGPGPLGSNGVPTSTGANRKLERIDKVKVKDDSGVEIVLALGVLQGAGFRIKQGGGTITFMSYCQVSKSPEVNWHQVKLEKKVVVFTMQIEGSGLRHNFLCMVSKAEPGADTGGVVEEEVELAWTKHYVS